MAEECKLCRVFGTGVSEPVRKCASDNMDMNVLPV
jgi:hypothetical protein